MSGWAEDLDNLLLPVQVRIYIDTNAGSGTAVVAPIIPPINPNNPPITPNGDVCHLDLINQNLGLLLLPPNLACATINRQFVGQIDYLGVDGKCYHADWKGTAAINCTPGYLPPRLPSGQIPDPFDSSINWLAANGHCYYTPGDTGGGGNPYGASSEKFCGVGGGDSRSAGHVVLLLNVINGGAGSPPVAYVTASDALSGIGNHGFHYKLPASYSDGKPHQAWVWAADLTDTSGGSDVQLPGSPLSFTLTTVTPPVPTPTPAPVPTPLLPPPPATPLYFVYPANNQTVSGLIDVKAAMTFSVDDNAGITLSVDGGTPQRLYWGSSGYDTLLNTPYMRSGPHTLALQATDVGHVVYNASITITVANP